MILIRLAGGLGNQIFQFGAGLLFAQKNRIKRIVFDDGSLEKYEAKRKNELLNFFDFSKLDFEIEFKSLSFVKFRVPKVLPLNISAFPFVSDKNFQTILNSPNKTFMFLDGYFQQCLTQNDFDKEVALLQNILIPNKINNKDACVIHIRGGDFVKLGWSSVAPKEYYIKAVQEMQCKFNQDKFYIVTDDREYSKTILNNLDMDFEFIGNSMYEDFKLIGSFKYRILSSSTFAFWASALADNSESIVIAPRSWYPHKKREIILPGEIS